MNHEESILQQQCVAWFRAQYPQYAMLLIHPINEGSGHSTIDRRRQGIHKAEGAVAGVPDLILFMPVYNAPLGFNEEYRKESGMTYGLGIEFKTEKGRQSQAQKDFEKMFRAAGYGYQVIKCIDDFRTVVSSWIGWAGRDLRLKIASAHVEIVQAAEQREKEKFYKIIGKKK